VIFGPFLAVSQKWCNIHSYLEHCDLELLAIGCVSYFKPAESHSEWPVA